MNLKSLKVSHMSGDPRLPGDLRPLLADSNFSSCIVLADISWMVR